ncbi:hypothetical protein KI387_035753, partial [Taxus chinensis]
AHPQNLVFPYMGLQPKSGDRTKLMGDGGDADYLGDLSQFLPPDEIATLQAKEKENESKGYNRKLNWKEKRKMKKEEQQKEEDEQIKRGYGSAIPSTNIGFKMLQQMGYNPGVALGKHGQGLLEPVGLEIKRSRTGLGRDHVEKEKQILKAKEMDKIVEKKKMQETNMMSEYGERKKLSWQSSKIVENYKKARAALSQLEEVKYAPPTDILKEKEPEEDSEETVEEEEEEEEEVTKEDLQEVLNTLKIEFHYCFYCGCQYESEEAMLSNCPGTEEEDH